MELSQDELQNQYVSWMSPNISTISKNLTNEENVILNTLLYLEDDEEFLVKSIIEFHISKQQVQSLLPGSWIKSIIFDLWLDFLLFQTPNHLSSRIDHSFFKSIVHCMKMDGTIFHFKFETELSEKEFVSKFIEEIKRNTNSKKISKIFLPICAINHGSLAILYLKSKQIVHIDTLRSSSRDSFVLSVLSKWMKFLEQQTEWNEFTSSFCQEFDNKKTWKEVAASNICAQRNGYDCVLYCLKFAELLIQNKEVNFNEEKALSVKYKILLQFRLEIASFILRRREKIKNGN